MGRSESFVVSLSSKSKKAVKGPLKSDTSNANSPANSDSSDSVWAKKGNFPFQLMCARSSPISRELHAWFARQPSLQHFSHSIEHPPRHSFPWRISADDLEWGPKDC